LLSKLKGGGEKEKKGGKVRFLEENRNKQTFFMRKIKQMYQIKK